MTEVHLHVYDVSQQVATKYLNNVLSKGGVGAYHAGVEVYGEEWSFGFTDDPNDSGLFSCEPKGCSMHQYRESINMGQTTMSKHEVSQLLKSMEPEWKSGAYDLLSRNCCSFSNAFCNGLGVGNIPERLTRLAAAGSSVRNAGASVVSGVGNAMERAEVKQKTAQIGSGISAGIGNLRGMMKK
eukprot:TRINITY_DN11208_c0_g1_i1.p1 TRINITY_DN11208_c0_g1~~TRINITY_DN11208_c0_g1_i1.p1  ORF type:complete len:200 (+),score=39.89 TRINITY_DN11208_c0_g1_i1:52-600(+)